MASCTRHATTRRRPWGVGTDEHAHHRCETRMQLDFVLFLLQPSLYLLFSSLCLLQFQMLYEYLVFYLAVGKNNPALAPLAQFFENASNNLQKVLGYVRMHCATRYDAKRTQAAPAWAAPSPAPRATPIARRGSLPLAAQSTPAGSHLFPLAAIPALGGRTAPHIHPPEHAPHLPTSESRMDRSIDRALTKCAPSDRAASPAA